MPELLERNTELERLGEALRAAAGGDGAVVAIEGPPGVGKTALLQSLSEDAQARGLTVLRARGVEFERALAYGVVRQLFRRRIDAALRDAVPGPARQIVEDLPADGGEPADPFAVLHGLYALCVAMADAAPVVLIVDDAQWADDASLRFLGFLQERLDGVAALVAMGLRTPGHGDRAGIASQLAVDPRTFRVVPGALSLDATSTLVRRHLADAPAELCHASHEATGGNPFYVRSLAEELQRGGTAPARADVAGLAPEGVTRAVLARLAGLGADAVQVAQAVALFGGEADVRMVSALTGLPAERVMLQADALSEIGVLSDARPLAFAHAIVRSAVEADLPSGRRAVGRLRAAEVLIEAGASAQRVALQLLATEPAGEPWVVDALERGAAEAVGPGGRETAAALLRRALEEPPPADRRADVLAALGVAERHAMAPEAIDRLDAALAAVTDEERRAVLVVELAAAREQVGQAALALELLEQALAHHDAAAGLASPHGALLEAQIHAGRIVALLAVPEHDRRRARARLQQLHPARLESRYLAGVLAFDEVARGGTAGRALELARMALEPPLEPEALASVLPMVALVAASCAGAPELVLRGVDLSALARTTGSPWATAAAGAWRALAGHHAGSLADAEADAAGALDGFANLPVGAVAAAGVLAAILLDRRDADAAAAVLEQTPALASGPPIIQQQFHDLAGAQIALARGDAARAATLARGVGDRLSGAEISPIPVLPWRSILARAELACGNSGDARDLAEQAVGEAQRLGEPGNLAVALAALGLTQDGQEGVATLERAVEAAAGGSQVALIRAKLALGGAQRRLGRRREAREPLREALALAMDCGAGGLARAAQEELRTAGVQARAAQPAGGWQLTASEIRVVRLAADGLSNREIAQTLFVTRKTVETHLYSAFRKLDVTSRRELASAVEERPELLRAS